MMHMLMDENLTDIFGFFKLCSCPCLEKVFIELPTSMDYSSPKELEDGPLMVFENLKVVRMNNFNGYNNDMWLAGFFLKRAINLEHMILVPARDFKDAAGSRLQNDHKSNTYILPYLHKLISSPRVSLNAMIILDQHDYCSFRPTHGEV